MNIQSIKKLVEQHDRESLELAETHLLDELAPKIEVEGADEGEQLTHVLAALWVQAYMHKHGGDVMTAIREYTKRVRTSIS